MNKEITLLDEFLTTLKELVEDINSSIGNWKTFDILDETIEEYEKEDAILKDLAGSLAKVYGEFNQ